jgi:hypothetical protein
MNCPDVVEIFFWDMSLALVEIPEDGCNLVSLLGVLAFSAALPYRARTP